MIIYRCIDYEVQYPQGTMIGPLDMLVSIKENKVQYYYKLLIKT